MAEVMVMIMLCNSPYMMMDIHKGTMSYFYIDTFGSLSEKYQQYIMSRVSDTTVIKYTVEDARTPCAKT